MAASAAPAANYSPRAAATLHPLAGGMLSAVS